MRYVLFRQFRFEAIGSVVKNARCSNCRTSYYYPLALQENAAEWPILCSNPTAVSDRIKKAATTSLMRSLSEGAGAAPCPICGQYQQEMIDWCKPCNYDLLKYAVILPVVALFVFFSRGAAWTVPVGSIFVSLCLILTAIWRDRRSNPSRQPLFQRLAIAQQMTVLEEVASPDKLERLRRVAEAGVRDKVISGLRRDTMSDSARLLAAASLVALIGAVVIFRGKSKIDAGVIAALVAVVTLSGYFAICAIAEFRRNRNLRTATFDQLPSIGIHVVGLEENEFTQKTWTQKILQRAVPSGSRAPNDV
jgi:hypothetical protein